MKDQIFEIIPHPPALIGSSTSWHIGWSTITINKAIDTVAGTPVFITDHTCLGLKVDHVAKQGPDSVVDWKVPSHSKHEQTLNTGK